MQASEQQPTRRRSRCRYRTKVVTAARRAHGGRNVGLGAVATSVGICQISAAPCPPTCPAPRLSALEGAAESPGTGAPVTRGHGAAHPCAAGHRARQRSRRTANAKDHARAHGSVDLASVLEPGSARAKMKPSAPPLLSQDWSLQLGASRGQPRDGVHLTRRGPNLRLSHREVQVLNTEHPYRSTRLQRSSNTLYALGAEARRPRQDVPGRP